MQIPTLRSPYDKVGGIVYFGRMLDKVRLAATNSLPDSYIPNLGEGFDRTCCEFLAVAYQELAGEVKGGASDDAALEWCFSKGRRPSESEIRIWNDYLRKRGWNDEASERLRQRKAEGGFEGRDEIQTFFDYIDADEGRPVRVKF